MNCLGSLCMWFTLTLLTDINYGSAQLVEAGAIKKVF